MHLLFVDPSGVAGPSDPALTLARSTGSRVTVSTRRAAGLVGTLTDEVVVVSAGGHPQAARTFCRALVALAISTPVLVVVDPAHLSEVDSRWAASDIVTTTASPAEFAARARRLAQQRQQRGPRHVRAGDLTLDLHRQTLHAGTTSIGLSAKECHALAALLTGNGAVLTRDELSAHCSDGRADHARHVDVFICRLRRKLGPLGARIETVRRVGYRLAAADDTQSLTAA